MDSTVTGNLLRLLHTYEGKGSLGALCTDGSGVHSSTVGWGSEDEWSFTPSRPGDPTGTPDSSLVMVPRVPTGQGQGLDWSRVLPGYPTDSTVTGP